MCQDACGDDRSVYVFGQGGLQNLANERRRPRAGSPRALVLAPTRELAHQISDVFRQLGCHLPLRCLVVYGGVGKQPQVKNLRRGIDIRPIKIWREGGDLWAEVEITDLHFS